MTGAERRALELLNVAFNALDDAQYFVDGSATTDRSSEADQVLHINRQIVDLREKLRAKYEAADQ